MVALVIRRWPSEFARCVFKIRVAVGSARGLTTALPDLGRMLDDAELRMTSASLCRVSCFRRPTGLSRKLPCSISAAISSKDSEGMASRAALGGTVFALDFFAKNSFMPFFRTSLVSALSCALL